MSTAEEFLKECNEALIGTIGHAPGHGAKPDPELIRKRIVETAAMDARRFGVKLEEQKKRIKEEFKLAEKYIKKDDANSPLLYPFQLAVSEFAAVAKKVNPSLPDPVVGTLPIGEMNAWTLQIPNSDQHVIVFHSGLGLFINRILKIVLGLSALTSQSKFAELDLAGAWQNHYRKLILEVLEGKDEKYEKHFTLLMILYLGTGDPNAGPPIYFPESVNIVRASMLFYTEMFIAGHEYAHVMLGHTNADRAKVKRALGTKTVDKCDWSHAEEFAADAIGASLTSAHSAEKYLANARPLHFMNLSCPDFFFSCCEVLEELLDALKDLRGTPNGSSSHPLASERRERIRELNNTITGEQNANLYGEQFQIILELLMERNRATIIQAIRHKNALWKGWINRDLSSS